MWMDESNRGGGEPPHGHGPVVSITETAFIQVNLSLPMFEGRPDRPTQAEFSVGECEHGQLVVRIRGCAIVALPCHATLGQRIKFVFQYLFGQITAPSDDEEANNGA